MNSTTVFLIIHGLLAVALLGAITHQAMSVWWPARKPAGSFTGRFRSVSAPSYANAIVLLYALTFALGGIIYPDYRIEVRTVLEQLGLGSQNGAFEMKEHFAAIGIAILPAYWCFWREPAPEPEHSRTRAILTAVLAFIVWWNFLVGHVLNNIRGFGS